MGLWRPWTLRANCHPALETDIPGRTRLMQALVKFAPGEGNLDILDVDEPVCGPLLVKVEVAFCGVCGTDLHVMHGTFRSYPPVILGHEFAGTVVEIGRDVMGVAI